MNPALPSPPVQARGKCYSVEFTCSSVGKNEQLKKLMTWIKSKWSVVRASTLEFRFSNCCWCLCGTVPLLTSLSQVWGHLQPQRFICVCTATSVTFCHQLAQQPNICQLHSHPASAHWEVIPNVIYWCSFLKWKKNFPDCLGIDT